MESMNRDRDYLPDGRPDNAAVQRSRLIVDALKFLAAKLNRYQYGDALLVETVDYSAELIKARERVMSKAGGTRD
jgi:hypothetical protein